MDIKQLLADTATEYAELTSKMEEDKINAKNLKDKVKKLTKELERQDKLLASLQTQ